MIFLISVIVLALVIGYVAGGRLRNFEHVRIRGWWLAPIGLLLQVQFQSFWHPGRDVSVALLIASYVLLLLFAALNIQLAGFVLIFIGLAMNMLVVSINGGMPVDRDALIDSGQKAILSELIHHGGSKHHLATDDDVLRPIADVIAIPPPIRQVVSAGDLVVYAGVVWLVVATMRGRPRGWTPWARGDRYRGRHRAQEPVPPRARSADRRDPARAAERLSGSTPSETEP
jgi:Family of unknown function (DUF5317)